MHPVLDDLITLLQLERIEDNIFRGESRDIGSAQVFGGQVLGQALSARFSFTTHGNRSAAATNEDAPWSTTRWT